MSNETATAHKIKWLGVLVQQESLKLPAAGLETKFSGAHSPWHDGWDEFLTPANRQRRLARERKAWQ